MITVLCLQRSSLGNSMEVLETESVFQCYLNSDFKLNREHLGACEFQPFFSAVTRAIPKQVVVGTTHFVTNCFFVCLFFHGA